MSDLMAFPGRSGGKKSQPRLVPSGPAGVVDAWAKEDGGIALSAGNYDITNAFMVMSLDLSQAEELQRRLGKAITAIKNKK